jgi:hypothetical protein
MRKFMLATPLLAVAALTVLSAAPASADTGVTFQVVGGALAISAPTATADLGTTAPSAAIQTLSGPLGVVTVTDARGGVAGWVASVITTAFTGGPTAVSASLLTYVPGTVTKTGTVTVTGLTATGPIGVMPVETATLVSGANTASWNPGISVALPAGAQAGTYTATLTHSIV